MAYVAKLSNAGGSKSLTRYVGMLAGNSVFVPSSYESIATVSVGSGGSSSISFTSIPQTYQHLQLRWTARNTDTSQNTIYAAMNGLTGSNYSHHLLYGGAAEGVGTENAVLNTGFFIGSISHANRGANCFSVGVADFLDYASTAKKKVMRSLSGRDDNTAGIVIFASAAYNESTPAITSLVLTTSGNFAQNSHFALYGSRSA